MRRRPSLLAGPAIGTALLAGLLGGCGGSSSGNGIAGKTPADVIAAAKVAVGGARSVHVTGSIVSGGTRITFDMDLLAGRGGRGQLTANGLGFELIETGGTVYIKGSPAYYRHIGGTAGAQVLQGRWLKAPATSKEFAAISAFTDLHRLVDSTLVNHGALAKVGTTSVNGQKVVGVTDTANGGTLYVAVAETGKPYPIKITLSGEGGGTIAFDRWNESVSLAAPPNAIDLAQLPSAH